MSFSTYNRAWAAMGFIAAKEECDPQRIYDELTIEPIVIDGELMWTLEPRPGVVEEWDGYYGPLDWVTPIEPGDVGLYCSFYVSLEPEEIADNMESEDD
jgi:hypothetical protein